MLCPFADFPSYESFKNRISETLFYDNITGQISKVHALQTEQSIIFSW